MVFGISRKTYWLMVLGRVIFGIGCEMLYILQTLYITDWFFDQELSLAIGISTSISCIFCFLSGIISGVIGGDAGGEEHGIRNVFLFGVFINVICFIMVAIMVRIHDKTNVWDMEIMEKMSLN